MLKILIFEELIYTFTQILLILLKTTIIRQQFWRQRGYNCVISVKKKINNVAKYIGF